MGLTRAFPSTIEDDLVSGNFKGSVRPQMIEKFSYSYRNGPATPNDYSARLHDSACRSLLTTTRGLLTFKESRTKSAIRRDEELLEAFQG